MVLYAESSAVLARAATHWIRLRGDEEVIERARRPFPIEPIRTSVGIDITP